MHTSFLGSARSERRERSLEGGVLSASGFDRAVVCYEEHLVPAAEVPVPSEAIIGAKRNREADKVAESDCARLGASSEMLCSVFRPT
ncbi:MAG: hypothetical protein DRI90_02830 [Deltaproteobacteria bacterium]|nr:MAG: hypothetical protein DRI90_02830 [Deltaproteobacteria bacterium]